MNNTKISKTVRRSVALPGRLVREAISLASPELKNNVNQLVTTALREFVSHRKRAKFELLMEKMSRDPAIRKESSLIFNEFKAFESDGLPT